MPVSSGLTHTPLTGYAAGEKLRLTASAPGGTAWVTVVLFRTPGVTAYQARPMVKGEGTDYAFELDTSVLTAPQPEYCIEAETNGIKSVVPGRGPRVGALTISASGGRNRRPPFPKTCPRPKRKSPDSPSMPTAACSTISPRPPPKGGRCRRRPRSPRVLRSVRPPAKTATSRSRSAPSPPPASGRMVTANTSLTDTPLPGAWAMSISPT